MQNISKKENYKVKPAKYGFFAEKIQSHAVNSDRGHFLPSFGNQAQNRRNIMNPIYEKPKISESIEAASSATVVKTFSVGDEMHCGHETSSALSIEFFTSISEGQWLDPALCTR